LAIYIYYYLLAYESDRNDINRRLRPAQTQSSSMFKPLKLRQTKENPLGDGEKT